MQDAKQKKKHIIILITAVIAFIIILTTYESLFYITGTPVTNKVIFPDAKTWNYELLYTYNNHDYKVTKNVVPSFLVGRKITVAIWNGPGGEEYDIYSIKTEWTRKQIAIKTKYGYLLANRLNTNSLAVSKFSS